MAANNANRATTPPPVPNRWQFYGFCLGLLAALACLVLAVKTSGWATGNMVVDYPVESREGASLFITDLLLRGQNPYALENRPIHVYVYGIGYPAVVYPFARVFGNTFVVHRTISCLFIVATCACLLWALRRDKVQWPLAVAAGMMLLVYLATDVNSLVRPDSLGLFLFFAGLAIPWRYDFSRRSLAAAVTLGLLGYLTKPYFVLGIPLLAAYLFLFKSKTKGIVFGLCSALAGLALFCLLQWAFECYFCDTFFSNLNSATNDSDHLNRIGKGYSFLVVGWLMVLPVAAVVGARRRYKRRGQTDSPSGDSPKDWRDLKSPLLPWSLSLPVFVLICDVFIIVLKMGRHNGADTIYWHHLITPFLIWVAMRLVAAHAKTAAIGAAALLVSVSVAHAKLWPLPSPDKDMPAQWDTMQQALAPCKSVFVASPASWIALAQGKEVFDTGQTEYYPLVFEHNPSEVARRYRANGDAFRETIRGRIEHKEFDAVVIQFRNSPLVPLKELSENYILGGQLVLPMPFGPVTHEIYFPRGRSPWAECRSPVSSIGSPSVMAPGSMITAGTISTTDGNMATVGFGTSLGWAPGMVVEVRQDGALVCMLQLQNVGETQSTGVVFSKHSEPKSGQAIQRLGQVQVLGPQP